MRGNFLRTTSVVCLGVALTACATSPLGRKQLLLVGDDQMSQMGATAFTQMKGQTPPSTDAALNDYVRCIAVPITEAAKPQTQVANWEIVVFDDPQVNAFALPGGKIGVYKGLFKAAKNDAQVAAVIGHEVGHVIAKHGAERVSEQTLEGGVLGAVNAFLGGGGGAGSQVLMAALGLGTQVGVALPHSRTQEAEADLIGEKLMAQAGFDPAQSVELWHNMSVAAGKGPAEWMSDHPANDNRISSLQQNLPAAEQIYQQSPHHQCSTPASAK
jgi:predicted Zn-dependent protease